MWHLSSSRPHHPEVVQVSQISSFLSHHVSPLSQQLPWRTSYKNTISFLTLCLPPVIHSFSKSSEVRTSIFGWGGSRQDPWLRHTSLLKVRADEGWVNASAGNQAWLNPSWSASPRWPWLTMSTHHLAALQSGRPGEINTNQLKYCFRNSVGVRKSEFYAFCNQGNPIFFFKSNSFSSGKLQRKQNSLLFMFFFWEQQLPGWLSFSYQRDFEKYRISSSVPPGQCMFTVNRGRAPQLQLVPEGRKTPGD